MRLRLLTTIFATTVVLAAVCLPSSASAPNAYALMKLVLADANAYNTVHFVSRSSYANTKLMQVTDAGRTIGRQTNTLTVGGRSNTEVLELIDRILYVKGDATILEQFQGVAKATANQLANKWFEVLPSNADYANVALGLTVPTAMSELLMTTSVTTNPSTTIAGLDVQALKGTTVKTNLQPSSTEVLYFSAGKKPLPIEALQTFKAAKSSLLFSDWNETITLVRPNATIRLT